MPVDPTRLDKFTQRAREAVRVAERDCVRLTGGLLTCEAILSALLSQDQNASRVVLERLSVDTAALKGEMTSLAAESSDAEATADETGWSQAAARAISAAYEEAKGLNVAYVGTEHLLLAAIQHLGNAGQDLIRGHGVTPEAVREKIKELQSGVEPEGTPDQWNELLRAELRKVVEVLDSDESDALGKKSVLEIVEELRRTAPEADEERTEDADE